MFLDIKKKIKINSTYDSFAAWSFSYVIKDYGLFFIDVSMLLTIVPKTLWGQLKQHLQTSKFKYL